jgi:membrane protein required for colicin V production
MSFLDILLGIFLVYGIIRGIWNGFFVELASFISILVGIYIAIKFSYLAQSFVSSFLGWGQKSVQITAFVITFIAVVIGVSLLAKFFTTLANFASLGLINKGAGGFFGLLKMILILSVSLNFFQKINVNNTFAKKETLEKSLFYFPIQKIAATIYPSVQGWYKEALAPKVQEKQ